MTTPAIVTEGLRKRFGERTALDGIDLTVGAGTVLGLLGPNGAGKTTAVRILTTLLRPDGGTAHVAGFDVVRQPQRVRTAIGLVGQNAAVDEALSARQNLELFGRLYHLPTPTTRTRAAELLDQFDLADTGNKPVKRFSGGMRRRLDLAASLILAPTVLFLDEPTTGLDPRGRTEVWNAVRALVSAGTTVLLTTQYLDEADQLAGHIAVIDSGRVIAEGTPEDLKTRLGGDRLDVIVHDTAELGRAAGIVEAATGGQPETDPDARRVSAPVRDRVGALTDTVRALADAGVGVEDIALRRPTLDEVFLHLTHTDKEVPA
ncbi:daunorubicin/doxorubicin resistance ABC transporter ATP-binding protein DrrA [Actinophytocola xinjiangensis]|uniref:Daunorubicin/doxorubicin resistance ABC transporter ATP-binding protein DrrA n=1 Tax=Actinophytocola xinjiangensis TaxID=485602 RepID=A0A7Z1AZQ3_9PSEU|nr:ATP-binding cassette domain-containing protein [Actinophytocola xinjiangensis]OLF11448.1 daunorubicin/doxorubicin resistance ABC transporter ATP-binding protein DrrA [Actinophytocola xinjiangensis]